MLLRRQAEYSYIPILYRFVTLLSSPPMGRLDDLARKRLAAFRAEHGYTQGKAGEAVGWTQTSVSKYELGDFDADLDTLAAFASFYETTLAALLSTEGPQRPADPRWQQLRAAYERLTEAQRDALLVMLSATPAPTKARPSGAGRRSVRRARTATPPRG